jgi:hypothetical protein
VAPVLGQYPAAEPAVTGNQPAAKRPEGPAREGSQLAARADKMKKFFKKTFSAHFSGGKAPKKSLL